MKKVIIDFSVYCELFDREQRFMRMYSESFPDEEFDRAVFNGLEKAVIFDPEVSDWKYIKELLAD